MKASFRGKYDADKGTTASAVTVGFNAGDVKLRASMTDATVVNGPSLNGLALAIDKPGSFSIDYNVPIDYNHSSCLVALDIDYHHNMLSSHQKVNPKEVIVGW